jgi:phosphoenolpyruvate carboxylase
MTGHSVKRSGTILWVLGAAAALGAAGCQGAGDAGADDTRQAVPDHVAQRIDALSSELELDEAQQARVENVAALVRERHEAFVAERPEHFDRVLAAVESGEVDEAEVHRNIDEKVDQVRATLHDVADELIALVESMDADQRALAASRLRQARERMAAFHERIESGDGRGALVEHLRGRLCRDDGALEGWLGAGE